MRLIRTMRAMVMLFLLLGISLVGAEMAGDLNESSTQDWDQLFAGMDAGSGTFDLSSLLSEDVISSILGFLLALFLSLLGISFS